MAGYSIREVEELLGISQGVIRGLVRAGVVAPARGRRGEFRFSFQDLIVLRTARGLTASRVPAKRVLRSLKRLRDELPDSVPLSGLRLGAEGNHVIVSEGTRRWQADTGQYLLDFDTVEPEPRVAAMRPAEQPRTPNARDWFETASNTEAADPEHAATAYRQAISLAPDFAAAYTNLGRLLHEGGKLAEAETIYRDGIRQCGDDPWLWFNLGVLLEDSARPGEAIAAYQSALEKEPDFADCHYNLALLHEAAGQPQSAIRHLREYRRLQPQ